jgi:streptogramin lyase
VIVKHIRVPGGPVALAFGEGAFWVLCRKAGDLDRIDPATNRVTKTIALGLPDSPGNVAVGYGSVWVSSLGFPIIRVDLDKEKVVQQFSGDAGGVVRVGFNSIWLLNTASKVLSRIDPKRVAATLLN